MSVFQDAGRASCWSPLRDSSTARRLAVLGRILRDSRRNGDRRWRFMAKAAEIRLRRGDENEVGSKSAEDRVDGQLPSEAPDFGCEGMTTPDARRRWHVARAHDAGREVGHHAPRPPPPTVPRIRAPNVTGSPKRSGPHRDTRARAGHIRSATTERSPWTGPRRQPCASSTLARETAAVAAVSGAGSKELGAPTSTPGSAGLNSPWRRGPWPGPWCAPSAISRPVP